jgi:hypothetical protein
MTASSKTVSQAANAAATSPSDKLLTHPDNHGPTKARLLALASRRLWLWSS